ncbi:MAG: ImmA/IrrE family metallo-endopeptidase [Candidatus Methanoculleus thermohydrogenotrophicum]|jgi:hypothetical protein|nr:ImmA/IrrE family metallo-endopeptidase [Candidatus Methanoculleus thermohydrogenotrophicum]
MMTTIRNFVIAICILVCILVSSTSGAVPGNEPAPDPGGVDPADPVRIDDTSPFHAIHEARENLSRGVADDIGRREYLTDTCIIPGDVKAFVCTDFATMEDYIINATCEATGEHCYVFVEEGLNVVESEIQNLAKTFDRVIHPTVTGTFGNETDTDGDPRIFILLLDIPEASHNSATDLSVAGYFDGRTANNLDIIFLDADARDSEMRSTLAHEFQHLIHHSHDPHERTWVDEGCSEYAEFLCFDNKNRAKVRAFNRHPSTSLVVTDAEWDRSEGEINQAHYGASFLWILYLAENFGDRSGDPDKGSFLKDLVADNRTGLRGIDATLALHGFPVSSEDVFKRWVVANYLDAGGNSPPRGYDGIDLTRYPQVAGRVDLTRQAGLVHSFPEMELQPWSAAYYEVRTGEPDAVSYANDQGFWMEKVVNRDGEAVIVVSPLRDRGAFVLTVSERRNNLTAVGSAVS